MLERYEPGVLPPGIDPTTDIIPRLRDAPWPEMRLAIGGLRADFDGNA
jgi:hypothetical protein